MKTITEKISYILPIILFIIITPIILYPAVRQEFDSSWMRSEFYFITILNVLFFIGLSIYLHNNIKSENWVQKYLVNLGILIAISFYYYVSLFSDSSMPTLGALTIISIIYILPGLLIVQLIASLIKKFQK